MEIRLVSRAAALLAAILVSPLTGPVEVVGQEQDQVQLIPREKLFGNPTKAMPRLSPDGQRIAFLAPSEGVMNVWVAPRHDLSDARPVTHDRTSGITQFLWAQTSNHVLYLQDTDGDEDYHVYRVDLASGETVDLTPFPQIRAMVAGVSERDPEHILVGINNREPRYFHDIYRINIVTAERELLVENPGFAGFLADDDYNVRLALALTPAAQMQIFRADPEAEIGWSLWQTIGAEDLLTTSPAGFDKTGQRLYMTDSRGRDTSALTVVDLATGEQETLAAAERADVDGVMVHPTEKTIQAVAFTYKKTEWQVLDESIQPDMDYLQNECGGEIEVVSRTMDDRLWIVAAEEDAGPVRYFLYDRDARRADFMFSHRPELEGLPLVTMHPVAIEARDGLQLVSYLSLPAGTDRADARPHRPLPLVLLVHGGPWARDAWGFSAYHQLLANRGYAVLSVNFRGSTGFGKSFVNAANRQWAAAMHDDLLDAVQWAVDQGIADSEKVAIMGGSYGGYATLVGLTFTPDVFACGVSIVGPSNLITLLENPPPYWMPIMPMMKDRVGDWESPEGREFLESRSPLTRVDHITRPLLIAQGANDPRVKRSESDQIVEAMQQHGIPVTYVLYPNEGHGFDRPENRISFIAITEAFLAEHLGGRYEPIGEAFTGADLQVLEGAEGIPGLEAVLAGSSTSP